MMWGCPQLQQSCLGMWTAPSTGRGTWQQSETCRSAHSWGRFARLFTYHLETQHKNLICLVMQARTGGITEFVPLPFVHMEAPIYLKGAVP